jgi:hypothetical protein
MKILLIKNNVGLIPLYRSITMNAAAPGGEPMRRID